MNYEDSLLGGALQAYPVLLADAYRGMATEEKTFPIQGDHADWVRDTNGKVFAVRPRRPAGRIPWRLAVCTYNEYSRRYGTQQSLERLAERGGFGWAEFAELFAAWAIRQGGTKTDG